MEDNRKTFRFYFEPEKVNILQSNGIYLNKYFEMLNDDKIFETILKMVPETSEFRRPNWIKANKNKKEITDYE